MSATKNRDVIIGILKQAQKTTDPERLRKLASRLQERSAWDAAAAVREKALEQERIMAGEVSR